MSPEERVRCQQAIDAACSGKRQQAYEQFCILHTTMKRENVTLLFWLAATTPFLEEAQRAVATIERLELGTLYDTLPSDALLVATLNASLQSTQAQTVVSLSDWALAQEFAEWWRERYHKIMKPEEREKIFFFQELSGHPAQSARIRVRGYEIPIVPIFLYAEMVVQTTEPKYHFFRLLVQRAYYR